MIIIQYRYTGTAWLPELAGSRPEQGGGLICSTAGGGRSFISRRKPVAEWVSETGSESVEERGNRTEVQYCRFS